MSQTENKLHNIYAAIFKIQSEMPTIQKSGKNTFFKSTANPDGSPYPLLEDILEACRPLEKSNGVLVMHNVTVSGDDRKFLNTAFYHGDSGTKHEVSIPLMMQKQDMQGLASAITYAKRQNISCVYNIQTEVDDDGNGSVIPKAEQKPQPQPQPKPQLKPATKQGEYFFNDGKYKGKHFSDLSVSEFNEYFKQLGVLVSNKQANTAVLQLVDLMSAYKKEKGI